MKLNLKVPFRIHVLVRWNTGAPDGCFFFFWEKASKLQLKKRNLLHSQEEANELCWKIYSGTLFVLVPSFVARLNSCNCWNIEILKMLRSVRQCLTPRHNVPNHFVPFNGASKQKFLNGSGCMQTEGKLKKKKNYKLHTFMLQN